MSVFFDHKIQLPSNVGTKTISKTVWHSRFALLAVASKTEATGSDGVVSFHHDEGELIAEVVIQRSVVVECLQWHPEKKLAAIGWQSGEISICDVNSLLVFEQSSTHRSPITFVQWSSTGVMFVSADESGLLSVWKVESSGQLYPTPVHQHRIPSPPSLCTLATQRKERDSFSSYFVSKSGTLYFLGNSGECFECCKVGKDPKALLFSREKKILGCISQEMNMTVVAIESENVVKVTSEAKLGGKGAISDVIWAPEGVLATCSLENIIRFWDCKGGENYVLSLREHVQCAAGEVVSGITYNKDKFLLAAVTSVGRCVIWKRREKEALSNASLGSSYWDLVTVCMYAAGSITQIRWGTAKHLLAVNLGSSLLILHEHTVNAHFSPEVSAVQVSPKGAMLQLHSSGDVFPVQTKVHISGIVVNKEHVAVWGEKRISVFAITLPKKTTRVVGTITSSSPVAALYGNIIITAEDNHLVIRTVQGVHKHSISLGEQYGEVRSLHINGNLLVAGTRNGVVKIWDMSRREPRLVASKSILEELSQCAELVSAKSNSNGSVVSIILTSQLHDGRLLLAMWNIDQDSVLALDPQWQLPLDDDSEERVLSLPPSLPEAAVKEQAGFFVTMRGYPDIISHHWDTHDPRLLVVEASSAHLNQSSTYRTRSGAGLSGTKVGRDLSHLESELVTVSMFVSPAGHMLIHDISSVSPVHNRCIGCDAPSVWFTKKSMNVMPDVEGADAAATVVDHVPLKDFDGLVDCDDATIKAMLGFAYHSTSGNMDEAFRTIKSIKTQAVWHSMARMCVKSQRLDVALVCLGNMGNARAAKAVRMAQDIPEDSARLAVLAVQLGMLDEAEELYRRSGRYDLLNKFYQECGQWQKAVEVAELHDRMHLKTTYYQLAKHSEALGEIQTAINSYEKSETHQFEVPRMLLDDPLELESYVTKNTDRAVQHWWAEYLESLGELESAMQYYEMSGDWRALVRILYFMGNTDRAVEVVEESRDKGAAYHLARQLCQDDDLANIKKAVQMFSLAKCYSPAIQLAKEHHLDDELMSLALLSGQEDKKEAAVYYEGNPDTLNKAIVLYHKAGEVTKALELCFQQHQFDVLQQIAEEIGEDANPEVVSRVAEFFSANGQFDKAVDLLIRNHQISEAIHLCETKHVIVTEDLAEQMTLPKKNEETPTERTERMKLLEELGDCCASQGSLHLATKKYTQAGNKVKAMKVLLKSGDTEKIVFFAGVSRQKEIYVMAANYLQSLDWRKDPEIMKNIITFYTKGRAPDLLASFYDVCAQLEIDEYQNYDKAAGALSEALKCLSKAKGVNEVELQDRMAFLQQRIALVKRFASARKLYQEDPAASIEQCQSLLEEPQLDAAVRVGDVLGLLVSHHAHVGNFSEAYSNMKELQQRIPGVNLSFYIEAPIIEAVLNAVGASLPKQKVEPIAAAAAPGEGGRREYDSGDDDSSVGEEVLEEESDNDV